MDDMKCATCGEGTMRLGFVADLGKAATGFGQWVVGALEHGPLGGAKLRGRQRYAIQGLRCDACYRLELYAREPSS